jgi:hypothetical protein
MRLCGSLAGDGAMWILPILGAVISVSSAFAPDTRNIHMRLCGSLAGDGAMWILPILGAVISVSSAGLCGTLVGKDYSGSLRPAHILRARGGRSCNLVGLAPGRVALAST